jgi:hypothetical protein
MRYHNHEGSGQESQPTGGSSYLKYEFLSNAPFTYGPHVLGNYGTNIMLACYS